MLGFETNVVVASKFNELRTYVSMPFLWTLQTFMAIGLPWGLCHLVSIYDSRRLEF